MPSTPLPRLKPDPIPEIHPEPEYSADPALAEVYAQSKADLQVPWMGVVAMAFAHYPQFWNALWAGLRPLVKSAEFQAACRRLSRVAESGAREIEPAHIVPQLEEKGYASREIGEISALIDVFARGNAGYLLIATYARVLLEERPLSAVTKVTAPKYRQEAAPPGNLTLIEPHHACPGTLKVYASIRKTMGLPFVNTDYRALARWPTYLEIAWRNLKNLPGSVGYMASAETLHNEAVAMVERLPNPGKLTSETLIRMAERDATAEEIYEVVCLFQWLLPDLMVNVACLRAQLLS